MRTLTAIFLAIIFTGCGLFGTDEEDTARVNANGVDGVRFGDSVETVLEKLGPNDSFGFADGVRGWYVYYWHTGPHAGLWVYFMDVPGVDQYGHEVMVEGPVDMFYMVEDFSGTTYKGIGIGATRKEVERAYGKPVYSRDPYVVYCLGKRDLSFSIQEDTVFSMDLHFYEPLGDGERGLQFCNQ